MPHLSFNGMLAVIEWFLPLGRAGTSPDEPVFTFGPYGPVSVPLGEIPAEFSPSGEWARGGLLEARVGIEPAYTALQAAA